mgnify:CR=1 FL=1
METPEFEKKFLRKWSELSARGNAVEYDRAVLVREAREKLGDKLRELLRKGLGLGPIAVSHAYVQADALGVVADKAVWVAGGWRAVRLIVAAESNDTRRLIGKAVLNESDLRGGPLSAGGVGKVVERVAPGLIERTKRSREPQGAEPAATGGDGIYRREIERLLEAHLIHPAILSEDIRSALGIESAHAEPVATSV